MQLKSLLLVSIFAAGTVQAECYMRSSSLSILKANIEQIADVQYTAVPVANKQFRCTATIRALVKGKWQTAEGTATKDTEAQACADALNSSKYSVLQEVTDTKLTMQEELICTDQKIPKIRTVKVGEMVMESEVIPDPAWPRPRKFKDGTECRRFVEGDIQGVNMYRTRGVICRVNETVWRVVDKW